MEDAENKPDRFELICGLSLAIFAALLAINDLGSGKFGGDEIAARSGAGKAYTWYASKSMKENLAQGQYDTLAAFLNAGVIAADKTNAVSGNLLHLEEEIKRYKKEKTEILLGSDKVGKENWTQDVDGELGKVRGAKEWDAESDALDSTGDIFDMATLFFQICLVVGAISLIMKAKGLRWAFYLAMVTLGILGIATSIWAFQSAFAAVG